MLNSLLHLTVDITHDAEVILVTVGRTTRLSSLASKVLIAVAERTVPAVGWAALSANSMSRAERLAEIEASRTNSHKALSKSVMEHVQEVVERDLYN